MLKDVDPDLRKQAIKELKGAAAPLQAAARELIPDSRPLTNWYNWPKRGKNTGWDSAQAKRGVKVAFRSGRVRGQTRDVFPLLTLIQSNPAGAIYDIAGRSTRGKTVAGQNFIIGLEREGGKASRTMWPAVEKNVGRIEGDVEQAAERIMDAATRKLRE